MGETRPALITLVSGWMTRLEGDSGCRKTSQEATAIDWVGGNKDQESWWEGKDLQNFSEPSGEILIPMGLSFMPNQDGGDQTHLPLSTIPNQWLCWDEQTIPLIKLATNMTSKYASSQKSVRSWSACACVYVYCIGENEDKGKCINCNFLFCCRYLFLPFC